MRWRSLAIILGCAVISTAAIENTVLFKCAFRNGDGSFNAVENCPFCYTVWNAETSEVLSQGCHLEDALECSSSNLCFHSGQFASRLDFNETRVSACCCSGPMCNQNFSQEPSSVSLIITGAVLLSTLAIVLSLGFFMLFTKIKRAKSRRSDEDQSTKCKGEWLLQLESNNASFSLPKMTIDRQYVDLDNYSIDSIISHGSFSTSYKAVKSREVPDFPMTLGLKVYGPMRKNQFYKEKAIYDLLQCVGNTHILRCHGSHEFASIQGTDHALVLCLEYTSNGALDSYLKWNTITWSQLCRMLMGISQGLAFLHSAIKSDEGKRLSICHRSLACSSIFVRHDLTCCIGNFGAAIVDDSQKFDLDLASLDDDDGNARYQAPELLETRLNCSLKQSDIYALGLIIWEVSRRCQDLYQGAEVPHFEHCYEKEIGSNPSLEQLKILVCKHRARPLFPEVWKDSNPAIQLLKETIMDSWDHDGEARLTSWCVVERVREMEHLWDQYKLVSQGPPILDFVLPNNTQTSNSAASSHQTTAANSLLHTNNVASKAKNNNVLSGQRPLAKIQPHQGLNPCLERNYLAKIKKEEPSYESNLVMGSAKDKPAPRPFQPPQNQRQPQQVPSPATSLISPIPYVQNNIHASSSSSHKKSKNHHGKNFHMTT